MLGEDETISYAAENVLQMYDALGMTRNNIKVIYT
jgi:hypothetical protein